MREYPPLGHRIAIFGPSGSGKTTLAKELGILLGLPVIELDALYHQPGWAPIGRDQFRAEVASRFAEHPGGWVVDGNYGEVRDIVLQEAATAVWLRLPFRTVYPRLVTRTLRRAWAREELWNTNRESWRTSFLSRESILLWGITNWRPHVRKTQESLDGAARPSQLFILRSPRDVVHFRRQARSAGTVAPGVVPAPALAD